MHRIVPVNYREALRSQGAVSRSLLRCKPHRSGELPEDPSGLWGRIKIVPRMQNVSRWWTTSQPFGAVGQGQDRPAGTRLVSVDYREALRGRGAVLRSLRRGTQLNATLVGFLGPVA